MLVVGVDGGATKTTSVVIRIDEQKNRVVVGRGLAGSTNRNSVGNQTAVKAMAEVVLSALQQAGAAYGDAAVAVFGLSGCDTESDVKFWTEECSKFLPNAKVVVENDSVAALCSGTGGELAGIVVISGTGSIGFGVGSGGAPRYRAGGWGPLLGDTGNGHSIGAAALAAVARAADQRGPPTPLVDRVLRRLGLAAAEDLLGWAYGGDSPDRSWDRVAGLAPAVFEAAAEGCPVSVAILERAADDVCELAETVARRLGAGAAGQAPVALVLAGGVLAEAESPLARAVERRLSRTLPAAVVRRPCMDAAEAAAHLAAATASPS